ncbi:MAG: tetratricopeptide repeat protein [Rhodobacteraceae bacterium]|nr:tetratricopeptide repeat protein [Paracoccaceae bacterium]
MATLFVAGAFVSPVHADGVAGPYLAAQAASQRSDYAAAATYFTQALAHDPGNTGLMEVAALSDVALGDFDAALPLAKTMVATGMTSPTANIIVLADQLKRGAFDEALAGIAAGKGLGPLVDGLVGAWALVGEGKMSDALAAFDKLGANPGLQAFALYHKALAMASVGDFEGAEKIFAGGDGAVLNLSRRGVIADAEVLSQLDRNPDAVKLLDSSFGQEADPVIDALRQRLKDGQTLPFDVVRNATDGLSEVFFSVAAALKGEAADSFSLVYARTAEDLRPDNADAVLLTGDLLESQGQQELAITAYGKVSRDDPAYYNAQLGRAQALYAAGQIDAGIDAMKQLTTAHPEQIAAQMGLGDLLRKQERYTEAAKAYDAAVALIQTPQQGDWTLFYVRGICNERQGQWDKAEPDFREALVLQPDQPEVLNYLGYAMVERGEKLPEALDMIKRAVAARPDDGYIVDSLSWVYYRTGQYEKALPIAEHASQLMPVDPVVTDHLGDVYWAVGRKLEAEFQWHRALSYDPDPKDAARIKRKLEIGLDAVLKEEGAAPLKIVVDNGSSGG